MKKSLVISTIATVLVVVVALTTATFAWFSASGTTTAVGDFEVSSAGGGVSVYLWDKNAGQSGAFETSPVIGNFALGGYQNGYEWNAPNGAAEGTTGAYTLNPIMPSAEIKGVRESGMLSGTTDTNNKNLPNVAFVNGVLTADGVDVKSINARPMVARFRMAAGFATTNVTITVTITPADATDPSVQAAQSARFVLIGQRPTGTGDETNPDFQFGTDYKYITSVSGTLLEDNQYIAADGTAYTSVTFTDDADAAADGLVVKKATTTGAGVSAGNPTSATNTMEFTMGNTVMLDCVLYVWLDGENASNSSSMGEFDFSLAIAGKDATAGG